MSEENQNKIEDLIPLIKEELNVKNIISEEDFFQIIEKEDMDYVVKIAKECTIEALKEL